MNIQQKDCSDVGLKDRKVDIFDEKMGRAYELKTYNGSAVDASIENLQEMQRDIYLRTNQQPYEPVWVFLDSGPTSGLIKELESNNISYLILDITN